MAAASKSLEQQRMMDCVDGTKSSSELHLSEASLEYHSCGIVVLSLGPLMPTEPVMCRKSLSKVQLCETAQMCPSYIL